MVQDVFYGFDERVHMPQNVYEKHGTGIFAFSTRDDAERFMIRSDNILLKARGEVYSCNVEKVISLTDWYSTDYLMRAAPLHSVFTVAAEPPGGTVMCKWIELDTEWFLSASKEEVFPLGTLRAMEAALIPYDWLKRMKRKIRRDRRKNG